MAAGFMAVSLVSTLVSASEDKWPEFSWDTVPLYLHFGNVDGLSDKDVAVAAEMADLICLEKGHGRNVHGTTEKGIEFDAVRLKEANPNIKVLYYWNAFLDYSMYDAHEVYDSNPDWWLKKMDGSLDKKNGKIRRYDLSNPDVRDWWTDEARRAIIEGSCDGVFMDAFPQVDSTANIKLWGEEKYDAIQEGLISLLKSTREKCGSNALIMYNGIRNTDTKNFGMQYIEYADSAIVEHFDQFHSRSKEAIAQDIADIVEAGKRGKLVAVKGWPNFNFTQKKVREVEHSKLLKEARDEITFPLACFLVAAQRYSYFSYSWGYRAGHGNLDTYPELKKPLGKPAGQAVREGWIYTRSFEHADVWVDLESRDARIEWK